MTERGSDRSPNPLMIFALLSVVLVTVGTLIFGIIVLGSVATTSNSSQNRTNGPYGIAGRPLPTEKDTRILFPETLGSFKRTALKGTIRDFQVTLISGTHRIDVVGSQAVNARLAETLVEEAAKTMIASQGAQRQLEGTPKYVLTVNPPIRFVYNRGYYFFDFRANSQAALDEFMKVFKY